MESLCEHKNLQKEAPSAKFEVIVVACCCYCCLLLLLVAVVVARTQNIEKSEAATQLSELGVGVKSMKSVKSVKHEEQQHQARHVQHAKDRQSTSRA